MAKKDANTLKRRQMQCMESVKLSFWRLYCKPFQFNLKCIFMITIPAQRRDAQTTETKNFYFDSIQIKDSTTNISDIFSIFWRDTKIRTLYYMKIVDSIC